MRKGAAAIDPLSLRSRNIRRRMLRNLIFVAVATASALVAVTLWNARSTHKRVAQARIEHATTVAAQEFEGRFAPVDQGLQMAWEWGRMGLIDATHTENVVRELTPVLRPLDKVTAVVIASDTGHEVHLAARRDPDGALLGWTTRTREPGSPEARYTTMRWGPEGKPLQSDPTTIDLAGYDPVSRPWFVGAKDHGTVEAMFRSAPYPLFDRQEYGVSQSMRWEGEDGIGTVVAFDMLLTGISAMLNEINVSDRGVAFLCNSAGEVFLPSSAGPSEQLPPVFVPPSDVDNRLVASAMQAWLGDGTDDKRPVHFGSGRGAGWAGFTLLDPRSQLWLGVTVPDSDIFGTPFEGPAQLMLLLGAILLAGVFLTIRMARRYGSQLRGAPAGWVDESSFAERVRSLVRKGEGATLEFKSTVRRNLKTGKNAKEIELAWLKAAVAFMNSDGGTVMIGVADDGSVCGIEADGFENEDRCRLHLKNLVNQHIGPEFSRLIRLQVQTVGGSGVALVECERSPKPVFLRWHDKDAFYIRSGPSSVELSSRQVLEYVDQRR